jgi:hypothetical protein
LIHAVLETLEQRQLLSVQGEYYNVDQSTYAFTSLVGRRTDANIDFAWGGQSPIAGAEGAAFAARWTGTLTPTQSGNYTFKTSTDDGVRLWINNSKIVDYWWRGVYDKYSAPVQLTAGQTYNVRMEYFQLWSGSKCSLAWSRDGGAYTAVPAGVLSLPTQTPYSGSAPSIDPAGTTLQAEDFDIGSNGVSYYDTTAGNAGGSSYRANIDADIETFATGARAVGYVAPGEWLEYAVDVPQGGDYTLDARLASSGQGGSFHVAFNDVDKTGSWTIPSTGSWTTYATQSRTVNLSAGQQIMRVCFDANGPGGYVGNVDWLKLTQVVPAAPGNVTATAVSSSRIDLSWQDNSSNESGFVIQRAADAQFTVDLAEFNTAANATSYNDTTVQPGQEYFYRVAASGNGGSSASIASAPVTAMLQAEVDPQMATAKQYGVEARYGSTGNWKLGLNINTSQPPQAQSDFVWTSGAIEPFTFISTAGHVATFTIGKGPEERTIQYDYDPALPVTDLILVAKASNGTTAAQMSNLVLDGVAVDGMLSVSTGGTTYQELRPLGADLSDGWTLTGNMKLTWTSAPSSSGLEFMIKAVHELPDLDIDSDNNNAFDAPDRNTTEDSIEDDPTKPGKILGVNDDDGDSDGIPDYADGFDRFSDMTADNTPPTANQGERFVPLVIQLPTAVDLSQARLKIEYVAAYPGHVARTGSGTLADPYVFSPGEDLGNLRLWLKDGNVARNGNSFFVASPGDFVNPSSDMHPNGYYGPSDLAKLGFGGTDNNRIVTLWVEAVKPGLPGDEVTPGIAQMISLEVDPDGDGPESFSADGVLVSAVGCDLLVDTNRDNVHDDDDNVREDLWIASGPKRGGAIVLPNADDDDNDHVPDNWPGGNLDGDTLPAPTIEAADESINNAADLMDVGELVLRKLDLLSLPDNLEITLTVTCAPGEDAYFAATPADDRVRIFLPSGIGEDGAVPAVGDGEIIGPSFGDTFTFHNDPGNDDDFGIFQGNGKVTFGIEGIKIGAPVFVTATVTLGGLALCRDIVQVHVAPFVAFSHKQAVDKGDQPTSVAGPTVYVSDGATFAPGFNNAELRNNLDGRFGAKLAVVNGAVTSQDRWWQDPFEIGYVQAPYGQMHILLGLPRGNRDTNGDGTGVFNEYARTQMMRDGVGLIPDFYNIPFATASDQSDGGNFEVQNTGGFGKVIMGMGPGAGKMVPQVVNFLKAQGVQTVIDEFDLTWMGLGHIDEIVSFASTAGSRARVASPEAAWALLLIAKRDYAAGGAAMLQDMNGLGAGGRTVDNLLADAVIRAANFNAGGYSDKMLEARNSLGFASAVSKPVSGIGVPAGVLGRAGYLDVYDALYTYGDKIEWRITFTGDDPGDPSDDFAVDYRKVGETAWHADGSGNRGQDFVSDSRAVYILQEWWDSTLGTEADDEITFTTQPSADLIEMPVLFRNQGGAVAYTNNVINSIVDGTTLFMARPYGPECMPGNADVFEYYAREAAMKQGVGFTSVLFNEERAYHNGTGSIHCGTNVLRLIPGAEVSKWWNQI